MSYPLVHRPALTMLPLTNSNVVVALVVGRVDVMYLMCNIYHIVLRLSLAHDSSCSAWNQSHRLRELILCRGQAFPDLLGVRTTQCHSLGLWSGLRIFSRYPIHRQGGPTPRTIRRWRSVSNNDSSKLAMHLQLHSPTYVMSSWERRSVWQ